MRLLVLLSGEHPALPEAEFRAVAEADGFVWHEEARWGRLLVGTLHGHSGQGPAPREVAATVSRLSMTLEVALHRVTCARSVAALRAAARDLPVARPGVGSFAVRAERPPEVPKTEGPGRREVEQTLGGAWSAELKVDLLTPVLVVRAWLLDDEVLIGDLLWRNDRGSFGARATRHRPFFSPISGDPRWMRALVNVAAGTPPSLVYDPLCGTGGVLLEAALAGHHVVGSDIDPRMVAGTGENLVHAGQRPLAVFEANVREAPIRFAASTGHSAPDAIVTDLPYGQSASTGKEGSAQVARWALEAIVALLPQGHRAVVGVSDGSWLEPLPAGLVRDAAFALRVHKSLTRTYVVLRAVPPAAG